MRFFTRDVLLVTVIVALAVGWAIDHSRYNQTDREILEQIKKARANGGEWESYPPHSISLAPAPNPLKE